MVALVPALTPQVQTLQQQSQLLQLQQDMVLPQQLVSTLLHLQQHHLQQLTLHRPPTLPQQRPVLPHNTLTHQTMETVHLVSNFNVSWTSGTLKTQTWPGPQHVSVVGFYHHGQVLHANPDFGRKKRAVDDEIATMPGIRRLLQYLRTLIPARSITTTYVPQRPCI